MLVVFDADERAVSTIGLNGCRRIDAVLAEMAEATAVGEEPRADAATRLKAAKKVMCILIGWWMYSIWES